MLRECVVADVRNWFDAKRIVCQDPRYKGLSTVDRIKCWEEYMGDEEGEKRWGKESGSKGIGREGEEVETVQMEEGDERVGMREHRDRDRSRDRERDQNMERGRDKARGKDRDKNRGVVRVKDDEVERERKGKRGGRREEKEKGIGE